MSDDYDIYVILDDVKPSQRRTTTTAPTTSSTLELKEISLDDDDDDGLYEYIDEKRDANSPPRRVRDVTRDVIRDAAPVTNNQPTTAHLPSRRRVLVTEGDFSLTIKCFFRSDRASNL